MEIMQECRCSKCNKLLGKVEGRAEIMCPRCKVLNAFNIPKQLNKELETKWYGDQWKALREQMPDIVACSDCHQLYANGSNHRCMMYDNAVVPNTNEKHCEKSIR
ncbi:Com family DNA-binding transcriptional regulator [Paenibacillus lautus]|uniref:Com family DNA-binding transcriptional regulator n=1 Tax=Paenibacillus lautus TaxID=1401 RepID=UPI003D27978A